MTARPPRRAADAAATERRRPCPRCRRRRAARGDEGLRLPPAARAGPARRRADAAADTAAVRRAGGDRRRPRLRRDRGAGERATRQARSPRRRPHARRGEAAPARRAAPGRRRRSPRSGRRTRCWPCGSASSCQRPGGHPADHRAVRLALHPVFVVAGARGLRRGLQVGALRPGAGLRGPPGLRDPGCCWPSSRSRWCRPASTSSATPPRPATAGPRPGAMGAGLYIVWPAFYTDVTDTYRLGRGGRLRTDLGGLYFNAVARRSSCSALWWADRLGRAAARRSRPSSCR